MKKLTRKVHNLGLEFRNEISHGRCVWYTDTDYAFKFCQIPKERERIVFLSPVDSVFKEANS